MRRSVNSEKYRIERIRYTTPKSLSKSSSATDFNDVQSDASSLPSPTTDLPLVPVDQNETPSTNKTKYHITKIHEKIKLTQKFRILSAYDPNTGIIYDLSKILELNLIDRVSSSLCLPSTRQIIALDEAIQLGLINADLIDENLETTNESYQYIQNKDSFDKSEFDNEPISTGLVNRIPINFKV